MNKTISIFIRLLSVAIQLVYVKSYIHSLTVVELGYSFYLTTLSYAINALLLVPADFYQQALLASSYKNVFPLGSILVLNKKIFMIAAMLAAVLGAPIYIIGKISLLDLLLIFGLSIFLYLSSSLRNYLNNRGYSIFTAWMLLLEAGLKLLSFLFFLSFRMSHISAFVLSTVTAFLVEVICLCAFFNNRVPFTLCTLEVLDLKTMLGASSAITFSAVCNWLQLQGYRIAYVWMGLPEVAGLYASVSNLGVMGMNALSAVFSQMLLPKVYSSRGTYIVHYARYAVILCLVVLLGYFALGHVLLIVLTKRDFAPYAYLMLFGVLVEAGNLLNGAASAYFTLRKTPVKLVWANFAGLALSSIGVSMCLMWQPRNCYLLGAALVGSQGLACATLLVGVKRDLMREAIHV